MKWRVTENLAPFSPALLAVVQFSDSINIKEGVFPSFTGILYVAGVTMPGFGCFSLI